MEGRWVIGMREKQESEAIWSMSTLNEEGGCMEGGEMVWEVRVSSFR